MKSLRTALRLLFEFTGGKSTLSGTELSQKTEVSKSHASKILAALTDAGLLHQDPVTHAYAVAPTLFALGSQYINNDALAQQAMPLLRALTAETGHSSRLSILDHDKALYVLGVAGPLFIDSPWRIGTYVPLHSTTAGRVMLAFMEQERATQLLDTMPLPRITENTVTDRDALRRIVAEVRKTAYCFHNGENTLGLSAMGVPVFGAKMVLLGVLSLTYPSHLLSEEVEKSLLASLRSAARTLSMRMNCPVYPYG